MALKPRAGARASGDVPPASTPIIPPAPTWATVLGAIFGGMTLVGFCAFALISGKDSHFVCNAFTMLAAVFAFGAALAAGFIGGAAAVTGNLGPLAKENPVLFSTGAAISRTETILNSRGFQGGDRVAPQAVRGASPQRD